MVFEEAAVEAFKECMELLFGEGATSQVKIQYCTKETINASPCYVGTAEKLQDYMLKNKDAMKEVGIREFVSDTCFISEGADGNGVPIEKPFEMKTDTKYVIYKKTGWESMGCCKPWEQFANEAEFIGLSID